VTLEEAQIVWRILRAQWPQDAVMRLFYRTKLGATHGSYVLSPEDLAGETDYATKNGWNSYVQMNPTRKRGNGRCSAADITHWSWFVVDIDPTGPNPAVSDVMEEVLAMMRNYFGLQHLHATVIFSGRGLQLWFPLEPENLDGSVVVRQEPMPRYFDPDDRVAGTTMVPFRIVAPRVMGYWLDLLRRRIEERLPDCQCTIDTSVSDLPRVMRLPYTWNFKANRPTTLVQEAAGVNLTLGRKLICYAPYALWKEPEMPVGLGDVSSETPWQRFVPHLTRGARIFLTEGGTEGGRHRQAAAALLSLKELGCGPNQTQAALLWGASLCSPPLEPREIIPMIDRHFQRRES